MIMPRVAGHNQTGPEEIRPQSDVQSVTLSDVQSDQSSEIRVMFRVIRVQKSE